MNSKFAAIPTASRGHLSLSVPRPVGVDHALLCLALTEPLQTAQPPTASG